MTDVISSGVVPRELIAGITWDAAAEEAFVELYAKRIAEGFSPAISEREARYAVERRLFSLFYKAQVTRAVYCRTDSDKRNVFKSWVEQFGRDRADRLASMVKSQKLSDAALGYE